MANNKTSISNQLQDMINQNKSLEEKLSTANERTAIENHIVMTKPWPRTRLVQQKGLIETLHNRVGNTMPIETGALHGHANQSTH